MKAVIVNETQQKIPKLTAKITADILDYFKTKKVRSLKKLKQKTEITLVFLSEAQMKKINNSFRKKNKATDILSFTSGDPQSLGELLLCLSVLKKQAKLQKHSFERELQYMLIHGVLHLLGYDHEESKSEEKLMFAIQDKCFHTLGPVQLK